MTEKEAQSWADKINGGAQYTTPPASQEQAQKPTLATSIHEMNYRSASAVLTELRDFLGLTEGESLVDAVRLLKAQQPSSGNILMDAFNEVQALKQQTGTSDVVNVCPLKDSVCGDRPDNWCGECPKRKQQPSGGEVVLPDGWVPLTIEYEPGYPEDVAFGPKRHMDRLKKWLDKHFADIATPKPEPTDPA
jgi:hypothetical protein